MGNVPAILSSASLQCGQTRSSADNASSKSVSPDGSIPQASQRRASISASVRPPSQPGPIASMNTRSSSPCSSPWARSQALRALRVGVSMRTPPTSRISAPKANTAGPQFPQVCRICRCLQWVDSPRWGPGRNSPVAAPRPGRLERRVSGSVLTSASGTKRSFSHSQHFRRAERIRNLSRRLGIVAKWVRESLCRRSVENGCHR